MSNNLFSSFDYDIILPFILVFGGCCSAMIFFEQALKENPGCSNFLTFTELSFISLESLIERFNYTTDTESDSTSTEAGRPPSRNSIGSLKFRKLVGSFSDHAKHALLWVSMSWLVNYAYSFKIGVPIHTVFRACNMVASLIFGFVFFKCSYSKIQCFSCILVTIGILESTLADVGVVSNSKNDCTNPHLIWGCTLENLTKKINNSESGFFSLDSDVRIWFTGIGILMICLCTQSCLGHLQKGMYDPYLSQSLKKTKETPYHNPVNRDHVAQDFLFTSSIASLTGCVFFWEEILKHGHFALTHESLVITMPFLNNFQYDTGIPRQMAWIIGNNITHACCIRGVFYLSTRYSALAVNVVLSMRKFMTVVISILWFSNPWTVHHTIGGTMVFLGGFLYGNGDRLLDLVGKNQMIGGESESQKLQKSKKE